MHFGNNLQLFVVAGSKDGIHQPRQVSFGQECQYLSPAPPTEKRAGCGVLGGPRTGLQE